MGYKSPIDLCVGELKMQQEGAIFEAVQACGVNVDKDELIKALAYDRDQYNKAYADGRAAFNQQVIEDIKDKIVDKVSELIDAWSQYNSELFMRGKIEGADLAIRTAKYVVSQTIKEYNDWSDPNE